MNNSADMARMRALPSSPPCWTHEFEACVLRPSLGAITAYTMSRRRGAISAVGESGVARQYAGLFPFPDPRSNLALDEFAQCIAERFMLRPKV